MLWQDGLDGTSDERALQAWTRRCSANSAIRSPRDGGYLEAQILESIAREDMCFFSLSYITRSSEDVRTNSPHLSNHGRIKNQTVAIKAES